MLSGTGAITVNFGGSSSGGIVHITAPNNPYSGTITLNNGRLDVDNNTALVNATVTVNDANLLFGSGVTQPVFGALAGNSALGMPSSGTLTTGGNAPARSTPAYSAYWLYW